MDISYFSRCHIRFSCLTLPQAVQINIEGHSPVKGGCLCFCSASCRHLKRNLS